MEDPATIALNLTFFGTLVVAFVMFIGLFSAFVLTLVLAGLGRGAVGALRALIRLLRVKPSGPGAGPAKASAPARKEPRLSADWAAAVVQADARATAQTKLPSRPEAGPERPEAQERKAG